MGTPAQIGKNEYQAEIQRGREANKEVRAIVRRIMQESSSSLIQALAGKIALAISDNEEAIERLEEIGRKAKNFDK